VALLAACCAIPAPADLLLVENGQPRATIVVAQDVLGAAPNDKALNVEQPRPVKVAAAAQDLQAYLEKMTGAKLPIVGDDQTPAGALILVGRSRLTAKHDHRIPAGLSPTRDEEGYAILADGDTLVLAGNDEAPYHGTEYAVAFFLHRLGVRWYMPGDFGEVVPKQPTLRVKPSDEVSRPDFKMRNWWGGQAADQRVLEFRWMIRNGMNPLLHYIAIPADSSIRRVLPPEKEKDDPAYEKIFAKDIHGKVYPHMPNLTSEESVQYAAEKIKDYFRKNPTKQSFGLGADDGFPRDYSKETAAKNLNFPDQVGKFNDPGGNSATEEWMSWVQKVAEEVYKEFPDHIITTNGYANRNTPAFGVTPDPKIWIMFAAIWSDTYHALDHPKSWMTKRQFNMLKDWTSTYNNIYMYNYLYYNLVGCGAPPIPLARRHMKEMPLLKQIGVIGFSDEGRVVRGESGVFPTWLRARMMWNANLDARALMAEFFRDWYGPAAKPAMAFWEEMEAAIENSIWAGTEDHVLWNVYTPRLIAKLESHLKKAEAAARGNEWARQRVLADRVTFDHLQAYMAMTRAEHDADFVEAAQQAERMIEVRKPATALSRFYWDPNPADASKPNEAYGFYYWGAVRRMQYYQRMADLTTGKTGEMIAVLPEKAQFSIDPRDDGRSDWWYKPEFDDRKWSTILTTAPFLGQGPYMDKVGYPYLGAMWYRLTVDVPASAAGKTVKLYCAAAETEAWVWVNGKFVGRRPYIEAYIRPNAIDMDVTDALVPGQTNTIAIRLHTNYVPAQMAAGLVSRLFLYAPKDLPTEAK
jgi:hypothetical protein